MTNPQHATDFEPLAREGRTDRQGWFAFMPQGGWHVSVFPTGPKGKRTFSEFHVTQEGATGNKHHFYTNDGHVQLNHLENVAFSEIAAWAHANDMAADFYQAALKLYVTPAMLQQELTSFQRRTAPVQTMDEYRAGQASQKKPIVSATTSVVPDEEDIDMFSSSDPVPTTTGPPPTTAPPPGPPTTTGPPPGPAVAVPVGTPLAVPHPVPVVAPPQIVLPLPQTALELHTLYERHLRTLPVGDDVRRRLSESLDQIYSRFRSNASIAELKAMFDEVFTRGLSL